MEIITQLIESMMQVGLGLFGWALAGTAIFLAVRAGELISDWFDKFIKLFDPKGGQ